MAARGEEILFADADGATKFSDISKLRKILQKIKSPQGHAFVVGSRAHMVNTEAVVKVIHSIEFIW